MPSIRILDANVEFDFMIGRGASVAMDHHALRQGLLDMAAKVNSVAGWSPEERRAFQSMKKIVFFEGIVLVNGHEMERSCCDEDDAIFYWDSTEFNENTDADVRASTFFHDCWHVVQFKDAGRRYYRDEDERRQRERDAVARQIDVARKLECSDHEIGHLIKFAASDDLVDDRFRQGTSIGHRRIARV